MKSESELLIIKNIISNHSRVKFDHFSAHLRVLEDFRIAGDDAEDFLRDFSLSLNVDVSGVKFSDYFPDESSAEMHYFFSLLDSKYKKSKFSRCIAHFESVFWGIFSTKRSYTTVTVGHLLDFSQKGKWIFD